MPHSPAFPLQVLYDGACSICAAAMEGYARREGGERLILVDVTAQEFEPERFGLPLNDLLYQLHVIDRQGHIFRGVDALRAIWQAFPANSGYGLLGRILACPPIHPLARLGYWCFARLRRFLPSRKRTCRIGRGPPP